MSGGSYDYLYSKLDDEIAAFGKAALASAQEMADDAGREGYAELADALNDYIAEVRQARSRVLVRTKRLIKATQAFEWWKSGDWGRDEAEMKFTEFGGEKTP